MTRSRLPRGEIKVSAKTKNSLNCEFEYDDENRFLVVITALRICVI